MSSTRPAEAARRSSAAAEPPVLTPARARLVLAFLFFLERRFEEGFRELQESVRLDPRLTQGQLLLAQIALHRGELEQAEKSCRAALEQAPTLFVPWLILSYIYTEQGDWTRAVACAREAVAIDATRPIGHALLADAYLHGDRLHEATEAFRAALRLNPQLAAVRLK